jgi:hypothetical protein
MSKRIAYGCDKCAIEPDEAVKFTVEIDAVTLQEVHLCPRCAGECLGYLINKVLDDEDAALKFLNTHAPMRNK